jgi:hypothetical protein
MATDYNSLIAEITDWSGRSGDVSFATMVPNFVKYAENRFNRELRIRLMEVVATTVCTDANGWVALPTDYREFRAVLALSSPVQTLEYVTPNRFNQLLANNPMGGTPVYFTVIGTQMRVYPVTLNLSLEITYFASVPSLNGTTQTTNAILTNIPDLYLFGALKYGSTYTGDTLDDPQHGIVSSATRWETEYQNIINSIKIADQRAEYPGLTAIVSDNVY